MVAADKVPVANSNMLAMAIFVVFKFFPPILHVRCSWHLSISFYHSASHSSTTLGLTALGLTALTLPNFDYVA
jgi:hypothetical protein